MPVSDPKSAWMPDWQAMQKQFFNAWTDAARGGATPSMPVHQGFDVWLKLFNGRDSGNEVLDKVVGSAKQFADFMQGVIGQLATTKPDLATPAAMREALEKAMGGMSAQKNPVLDALRSVSSEGAKGFEDNRFTIIPNQDKRFDKVLVAAAAGKPSGTSKPARPKNPDPKAKPDTKAPVDTKAPDPGDDSGLGSDLKNPFGKK